jgi:hypothetical protein
MTFATYGLREFGRGAANGAATIEIEQKPPKIRNIPAKPGTFMTGAR